MSKSNLSTLPICKYAEAASAEPQLGAKSDLARIIHCAQRT